MLRHRKSRKTGRIQPSPGSGRRDDTNRRRELPKGSLDDGPHGPGPARADGCQWWGARPTRNSPPSGSPATQRTAWPNWQTHAYEAVDETFCTSERGRYLIEAILERDETVDATTIKMFRALGESDPDDFWTSLSTPTLIVTGSLGNAHRRNPGDEVPHRRHEDRHHRRCQPHLRPRATLVLRQSRNLPSSIAVSSSLDFATNLGYTASVRLIESVSTDLCFPHPHSSPWGQSRILVLRYLSFKGESE